MAIRRVRWTMRVETRRAFLERTALVAAWAGLAACSDSESDSGSAQAPEGGGAGGAAGSDGAAGSGSDAVTGYGPITPNEHFYITSCCANPTVDIASWALSIKSRGVELVSVGFESLLALPAREKEHTLECISAGPAYLAISNAIWTGLPLSEILETVGVAVPAGTVEIKFECADGYSTSLPVSDLNKPVWLVWLMNGVELPIDHGYPVRLLVPGRYGMKNPKWISSVDFIDTHHTGFWEESGWSNEAPYLTNTLVHDPHTFDDVPKGDIVASGTAFAGSDPIVSVEVSVDGGAFGPATLDYAPGADIWTLWHCDARISEVGSHAIQARCTTASGAKSSSEAEATDYLEGFDGSAQVRFNVV